MIARVLLFAALVALIAALVQWRVVDREPVADEEEVAAAGLLPDRR